MEIKYREMNEVVEEWLKGKDEGHEFTTEEVAKELDKKRRRVKTALQFFKRLGVLTSIGHGSRHRWRIVNGRQMEKGEEIW